MTKSTVPLSDALSTRREVRPFLLLEPSRASLAGAEPEPIDTAGQARLEDAVLAAIPVLVRSLVDYTIALQNGRALEQGNPQPIQLSVLNRRRRAARAWLLAIGAGAADAATARTAASQWLPLLVGVGPDRARATTAGRELIEFVRGAVTACVFDAPRENLLRDARALHVLESTLASHLAALLRPAPTAG